MKNKQYKRANNWLHICLYCLLLTVYCLLLITACGRRGDPVLVKPLDEKAVQREKDQSQKAGEKPETLPEQKSSEQQTIQVTPPTSPTGLVGVYTQQSIVLTWDEVAGQEIKLYRIYRLKGEGYILVGETVTPAFTDKNVEPNIKYYYKVSAVGVTEGPLSKEIQIITEVH